MAFAAASLSLTVKSQAVVYTETGDAGDLPATAQVITGTPGIALDTISGATTLTNGIFDSDMYQIYISSPSTFSASNTAFVAGSNNFDSQIMLFDSTGKGIVADDDAPNGGEQSSIPAGSFTGAAGTYYLLISGSGRYAASAGGVIFPNFTDGTTDPTVVYGPTGPGGSGAITTYSGNSSEGGSYKIALTGALLAPAAVPEPSTWAFTFGGALGLFVLARGRREARVSL